MDEIPTASHLIIGLGGILMVAGIIQMFLATVTFQRGRRGRIHAGFTLQKPKFIFFGVVLVLIGVLLLSGPLVSASN